MKFNDGKTISAYVRSKLHSGYITVKGQVHAMAWLGDTLELFFL